MHGGKVGSSHSYNALLWMMHAASYVMHGAWWKSGEKPCLALTHIMCWMIDWYMMHDAWYVVHDVIYNI